jgi:hypothetical protein
MNALASRVLSLPIRCQRRIPLSWLPKCILFFSLRLWLEPPSLRSFNTHCVTMHQRAKLGWACCSSLLLGLALAGDLKAQVVIGNAAGTVAGTGTSAWTRPEFDRARIGSLTWIPGGGTTFDIKMTKGQRLSIWAKPR